MLPYLIHDIMRKYWVQHWCHGNTFSMAIVDEICSLLCEVLENFWKQSGPKLKSDPKISGNRVVLN